MDLVSIAVIFGGEVDLCTIASSWIDATDMFLDKIDTLDYGLR